MHVTASLPHHGPVFVTTDNSDWLFQVVTVEAVLVMVVTVVMVEEAGVEEAVTATRAADTVVEDTTTITVEEAEETMVEVNFSKPLE